MRTCLIVSGGQFAPLPQNFSEKVDYVIACDSGFENAQKLALKIDLLVGDMDSSKFDFSGEKDFDFIKLPCEKDDTDTLYAIKKAIELKFEKIILCCAFSGRLDHEFANLQSLIFAKQHGLQVCAYGNDLELFVLRDKEELNLQKRNAFFSVFSYSKVSKGVSIKGAKYEVENCKLFSNFPLGISNEWKSDSVKISLKKGLLFVMVCHD